MKREREEEEAGGAAMSPSLAGGSSAARVSLLGRAMESPSGFPSLRAPSPIVRAMRTRLDPPPPPLAAAPAPPPPPPPPLPQIIPGKRRRGRPRNCDRLPPPPGFLPTPRARAPPPTPAAHGEASCDESFFPLYFCSFKNGGKKRWFAEIWFVVVDRARPIGWAPATRAHNRCGRGMLYAWCFTCLFLASLVSSVQSSFLPAN